MKDLITSGQNEDPTEQIISSESHLGESLSTSTSENPKDTRLQQPWDLSERETFLNLAIEHDLNRIDDVRPAEKFDIISRKMRQSGFFRTTSQLKAQWYNERRRFRCALNMKYEYLGINGLFVWFTIVDYVNLSILIDLSMIYHIYVHYISIYQTQGRR